MMGTGAIALSRIISMNSDVIDVHTCVSPTALTPLPVLPDKKQLNSCRGFHLSVKLTAKEHPLR